MCAIHNLAPIVQDVNRDSVADTKVGTLDYFAPEVLDLRQGESYDATQAVGMHTGHNGHTLLT